jgi:hypothetical protein
VKLFRPEICAFHCEDSYKRILGNNLTLDDFAKTSCHPECALPTFSSLHPSILAKANSG